MMRQFNAIKQQYPDAMLLFRVGDFYETFGEDAVRASQILGITLTSRAHGASNTPLAGIPFHALDNYLPRLVRAGLRVAICEQLEDPKLTKSIVKRGVTELVTPGLLLNENVLDARSDNFLAACFALSKEKWGMAFLDISTGRFLAGEGDLQQVKQAMGIFAPKECIGIRSQKDILSDMLVNTPVQYMEEWVFDSEFAEEKIQQHFGVEGVKGFGLKDLHAAVAACGAILHYLQQTHHHRIAHLNTISRIDRSEHLWLDPFTVKNLELIHSQGNALADILDHTLTPMGSRMLRRWLLLPLCDLNAITQRHSMVDFLLHNPNLKDKVGETLKTIGDIERLGAKVSTAKLIPREIPKLAEAIEAMEMLRTIASGKLSDWLSSMKPLQGLAELIRQNIRDDAPTAIGKGPVFKEGCNESLDQYRQLAWHSKDRLLKMQQNEIEQTGIGSLKVGYNHIHGYYFEVTHVHKDKVPENWIRKQTLTSAERYINEELKIFEEQILSAEEKMLALEQELYNQLLTQIQPFLPELQFNAQLFAGLDCLYSFAHSAENHHYCKPIMHEGFSIEIQGGRHPVIEQMLPVGERYIANDILLDENHNQLLVITGPNMSGKSAILRQTALIVLMAQMGSYVPAQHAKIGIYDRIFTRVGAADNLSGGESTFMVEMHETAAILNNLSNRSLILLDEIGRGTSTYDGVSIAWAIVEHLHALDTLKPRTLFATHYHELNELAERLPRVKNFHVSIKEQNNKVIFLRKLTPGGSEHSFGIHVARMAGMPKEVVERAGEILRELETNKNNHSDKPEKNISTPVQLSLFQLDDPTLLNIREKLNRLDIHHLTPVEALVHLESIKKLVGG
jgi:DNA mismatch repair protein MutS